MAKTDTYSETEQMTVEQSIPQGNAQIIIPGDYQEVINQYAVGGPNFLVIGTLPNGHLTVKEPTNRLGAEKSAKALLKDSAGMVMIFARARTNGQAAGGLYSIDTKGMTDVFSPNSQSVPKASVDKHSLDALELFRDRVHRMRVNREFNPETRATLVGWFLECWNDIGGTGDELYTNLEERGPNWLH